MAVRAGRIAGGGRRVAAVLAPLPHQPGQARLGGEQAAGQEDEERHDALEQLRRADQQQEGAQHGPDGAGGAEGEAPGPLAFELAPVAERPSK